MQIATIYQINNKIGQLGGKSSPRQYIDTTKHSKKPAVKYSQKKTYISQIEKLSKVTPGPGKYFKESKDKKKKEYHKKIDFEKQAKKPVKNYIYDLLKLKQKIPGVGQYNPEVDHTQQIRHKYSIIGDKTRKITPLFKNTAFDGYNIDTLNVDPGSYDNLKPMGVKKRKVTKEQNNPQKEKKTITRSKSLPKIPNPQSYYPVPQSFDTFQRKMSLKSIEQESGFVNKNFSTFGKGKRTEVIDKRPTPGPKYSLISQWSPKNDKESNLFKSIRSTAQVSIYH